MTRFIVVRHGLSEANKAEVFAGLTDAPLLEKGKLQAEYVAQYLAKGERIDRILYSGLTRTRQTAEPSARALGLPLHAEPGLAEIFAGLWEGLSYRSIDERFHEEWMGWLFDFSNARCPMGESVRRLYLRVERTVHRLAKAHEGQTLLLFTHCTPLRVMCAMASGLSPEQIRHAAMPMNASVNVFRYENGKLLAEEINRTVIPLSLSSSRALPPPPLMPVKNAL